MRKMKEQCCVLSTNACWNKTKPYYRNQQEWNSDIVLQMSADDLKEFFLDMAVSERGSEFPPKLTSENLPANVGQLNGLNEWR